MLDTLVYPNKDGFAYAVISNPADCSSCVDASTIIGKAVEVEIIKEGKSDVMSEKSSEESLNVRSVELESVAERKKKLLNLINRPALLNKEQSQKLLDFISAHHTAFSLDELE